MFCYRIAGITLQSYYEVPSFAAFVCGADKADVTLEGTEEMPGPGKDRFTGPFAHRRITDGWFFHMPGNERQGLFASGDYTRLRLLGMQGSVVSGAAEQFVRIALECALVRRGYVTLHSSAIVIDGEAYAFTGPSGIGKSTRANAWIDALEAERISGDRPLIRVSPPEVCGVPWDGKEQCFRNVRFPLKAIFDVRRSDSVYIRSMSFPQRRKLLLHQCFLPMWDTETAAAQMANIMRLSAGARILRIFCGKTEEDARMLREAFRKGQILKEEPDMKAKPGFVLRNVMDEHILMPTGDNIGVFSGAVLLNKVAAMVWEKLQTPVSRDDLLRAVLERFDVEEAVASADLDRLLRDMKEKGMIEDD